jgi:hypothetical protein
VVAGDHTAEAGSALRWAVLQAAQNGACVVVVNAFDVRGRADLALERDLGRARRDARYRTQSWVVEVLAGLGVSVPVVVSTPDGSALASIAKAAEGARLVVVGEPAALSSHDPLADLEQRCDCPVVRVAAGDAVPV